MRRSIIAAALTTTAVLAAVPAPAHAADMNNRPIAGRVTSAFTKAPLAGICVAATNWYTATPQRFQTTTDGDGLYHLFVPPGTYNVWFRDCSSTPHYLQQWWDNARRAQFATPVTVGALSPAQVGIDAVMQPITVVSGVVTAADTSAPLEGICITADRAGQPEAQATTDAGGRYQLVLTNGRWGVGVYDCRRQKEYLRTGGSIYVDGTQSNSATLDFTMARGATISGTVTDEVTGEPIADICAFVSSGSESAPTGPDGAYSVGGVDSGSQFLWFSECDFTSRPGHDYATDYFHHSADSNGATLVQVQAPNTTIVDESLVHSGTVTGTVTDATTGAPVQGVFVYLANVNGSGSSARAETGPDGTYSLTLAYPGDGYTVQFNDFRSGRYESQYWNDEPSLDTADTFSITASGTISGIDAAMQPR